MDGVYISVYILMLRSTKFMLCSLKNLFFYSKNLAQLQELFFNFHINTTVTSD